MTVPDEAFILLARCHGRVAGRGARSVFTPFCVRLPVRAQGGGGVFERPLPEVGPHPALCGGLRLTRGRLLPAGQGLSAAMRSGEGSDDVPADHTYRATAAASAGRH